MPLPAPAVIPVSSGRVAGGGDIQNAQEYCVATPTWPLPHLLCYLVSNGSGETFADGHVHGTQIGSASPQRAHVVTDKSWKEEVERAVAGAGLPWVVRSAWLERHGEICAAEVIDNRSGADRVVRVSAHDFPTATARRAEIVRQLPGGR